MLLVIGLGFGGCATTLEVEDKSENQAEGTNSETANSGTISPDNPEVGKGEPIYSTSVAIRLAELALKREGVDFSDRGVLVSFCEGVYTVTFEKPGNDISAIDFVVNIDADTSKVIKVVTSR